MEELLSKATRAIKFVLFAISFLGFANAALVIWMITQIVANGQRVEVARAELIERVAAVDMKVVALSTALGESPEKIILAAHSLENARDEYSRIATTLGTTVSNIAGLDAQLTGLNGRLIQFGQDIDVIRDEIYSEKGLATIANDLREKVENLEAVVNSLQEKLEDLETVKSNFEGIQEDLQIIKIHLGIEGRQ